MMQNTEWTHKKTTQGEQRSNENKGHTDSKHKADHVNNCNKLKGKAIYSSILA